MTPAQLAQSTGARMDRAQAWAPCLSAVMALFAIDTPQRQAMFLAQIGHESGGLRYTTELWGPTPAQSRYEGRIDLGNTQPGDGFRFRGRGLIQTTGRANYKAVGLGLGQDFEGHPEALTLPENAALSAAWFWREHGLNAIADSGDFEKATRRINGGINGLADRQALYSAAQVALA